MKKPKNFIASYMSGEVSLIKSYWLISTLSVMIISTPLIYAEVNDFNISSEFANFLFYYIYFILGYALLVYVGCWNSASYYIYQKKKIRKRAFWGYAAKVSLALGILRGILGFFGIE